MKGIDAKSERFLRIRKDRVILLSAIGLAVCAGLAALGY